MTTEEKHVVTYRLVTPGVGDIHEGVLRLLGFLSTTISDQVRSPTRLKVLLVNPSFQLLVAWDDDKTYPQNMVGMASIFYQRTLTHMAAEINEVVTDPDYRGQGIGEELMQRLIAGARQYADEYHEEIRLSLTSRPSRIEANGLYHKLGFTLAAHAEGKQGTNYYRMTILPRE